MEKKRDLVAAGAEMIRQLEARQAGNKEAPPTQLPISPGWRNVVEQSNTRVGYRY